MIMKIIFWKEVLSFWKQNVQIWSQGISQENDNNLKHPTCHLKVNLPAIGHIRNYLAWI